jgi:segregation and condensation protein A
LMELECYRQAARQLASCKQLGRDTFARPPELPAAGQQLLTDEAQLQEVSVFALVKSFDAVLTRTRRQVPEHQVALATVTIRERLEELCSALQPQELVAFEDVLGTVPVWDRVELVVTFMALLELTRLQLLKLYQSERGVLYVKALFRSRDEVWQRLKVSQEENHAAV